MRKTLSISLVATLTACTTQDTSIEYRSTFDGGTKGLILHEDGEEGHAGMFGTNCPFDTSTGDVTGDYDLPGEDEDVQDGEPTEIGEITLAAVIPGTIHVLDKTGGEYTHVPLELDGVRQGRLLEGGVVGMTADCRLSWLDFEGGVLATQRVDACQGLEVDPLTGLALVGDPDGAWLTDGGEPLAAEVGGDLVAFDDVAGVFYVATAGERTLTALQTDGSVLWSVRTEGVVTALDDGGLTGTAGVVLSLGDGGAVAFYDGLTGERTRFAETPTAAEDLSVSGDGSVVALVRPEQTFFYSLGD